MTRRIGSAAKAALKPNGEMPRKQSAGRLPCEAQGASACTEQGRVRTKSDIQRYCDALLFDLLKL